VPNLSQHWQCACELSDCRVWRIQTSSKGRMNNR